MSAKVIRVTPRNTESIIDAAAELIKSGDGDGSVARTILLSSSVEVDFWRMHIACKHPDLSFDLKIMTVKNFVLEKWELFGDGRRLASSTFIRLAVMSILTSGVIGGLSSTPGTAAMIEEIARRGFGAKGFEEKLELVRVGVGAGLPGVANAAEANADTSAGEAVIWQALSKLADMMDELDMIPYGRICSELASCLPLGSSVIAACESFSRPEMEMLCNRGDIVLLGFSGNSPADAVTDSLADAFLCDGAVPEDMPGAAASGSDAQNPELASLGAFLFGQGGTNGQGHTNKIKPTGQVSFALAKGPYAEAPLLAEQINSLVKEEQDPAKIFVVQDGIERLDDLVERLLEYGIPVCGTANVELATTGFVRALQQLLLGNSGDTYALIDFVNSGFSGVSSDKAAKFGHSWRRSPGLSVKEKLTEIADCSDEAKAVVDALRSREWQALLDALFSAWNSTASPTAHTSFEEKLVSRTHQRLSEMLVHANAISQCCSQGLSFEELISMAEAERIAVKFLAVPGGWENSDGEQANSDGEQVKRDGRSIASAVRIGSFKEAGLTRCEVLVLAGMTATKFPVHKNPSSADTVLESVNADCIEEELDLARRSLHRAVAATSRRLIVERVLNDESGEELRPSVLMEEIADCYCEDPSNKELIDEKTLLPKTLTESDISSDAIPKLVITKSEELNFIQRKPSHKKDASSYSSTSAARELSDSEKKRLAQAVMKKEKVLSASFVAPYLECPYKWFVQRVLQAEAPDVLFDNRAAGSFMHKILCRFYKRLSKDGNDPRRLKSSDLSQIEKKVRELADDYLKKKEGDCKSPFSALREIDRRAIDRYIKQAVNLLKDDVAFLPDFTPTYFERKVKFDYADRLFKSDIDRVDVDAKGRAVIIDYKGGVDSKRFNPPKGWNPEAGTQPQSACDDSDTPSTPNTSPGVSAGSDPARRWPEKIQTIIYAAAVESELGLEPVGLYYRSYSKRRGLEGACRNDVLGSADLFGLKDGVLTPEKFEAMRTQTEAAVKAALDQMEAGEIPRKPSSKDACKYCPAAVRCSAREN